MRRIFAVFAILGLGLAGAACEQVKSYNPLSNTIAGPIPWVEITQPRLLQPQPGQKFRPTEQPLTLLIENASSNGPRPLSYTIQVAADSGFTNLVLSREAVAAGSNGQTSFRLEGALADGRTYFWRARAEDGANTGQYAAMSYFEIEEPVVIQPPILVSPSPGATITSLRPPLVVNNAARTGPHGTLFYQFEIALDQAFAARVYDGDSLEGSGQTIIAPPVDMPLNTLLFWRVRVTDGQYASPWSATATFRTPATPPGPPPPGPPSGPPSTACNTLTDPLQILECLRPSFPPGQLDGSDAVNFLTAAAIEFNRAGVNGGGFGLLRKDSGNNCNGYSCDILCQGQGPGQNQHDVLQDETYPQWGPPLPHSDIRVDVCVVK